MDAKLNIPLLLLLRSTYILTSVDIIQNIMQPAVELIWHDVVWRGVVQVSSFTEIEKSAAI